MNNVSELARLLDDGIGLVEACHGRDARQLADAGLPDTIAKQLAACAETYFGETAFTGLQRTARNNARARRHNLATLLAIETYTNRLKPQRDKWSLRAYATSCTGPTSKIKDLTRKKVAEMKGPPKPPPRGVKLTRRKDRTWSLNVNGTSDELSEVAQHIKEPGDLLKLIHRNQYLETHGGNPDVRAAETDKAADAPALASALPSRHVVCSSCGETTEAKQVVSGLRTNIVITLDELTEILDDRGDDLVLRMTNGATMTGRDFVTRVLADAGLVTLIHPVRGPMNLYRTQRFASDKQRLMAMAENPICPWKGCHHPADLSEIHHMKSWKRGGSTNPENLTVACPYHNGINDDDPTKPRRGRLERVKGEVRWVPPWASRYAAAA